VCMTCFAMTLRAVLGGGVAVACSLTTVVRSGTSIAIVVRFINHLPAFSSFQCDCAILFAVRVRSKLTYDVRTRLAPACLAGYRGT
jgi:hypothetical protein